MCVMVIAELTMPTPTPNSAYVTIRNIALDEAVSCDSAALERVSAAPAITSGPREEPLASMRPDSGAHSAMAAGIGKLVRPARTALQPRTSCRCRLGRH